MVIVGMLTGLAGLGASIIPLGLGFDLEESIGLKTLFSMRGPQKPPPDILIVAMDKSSAAHLGLSAGTDEWPRSHHARLVGKLAREGARLIVFDIVFKKPGDPDEDAALADAMLEAGNVVLCSKIEKKLRPPPGDGRFSRSGLSIETLVPPIDILTRSAVATAAFPLPKVPIRVSQYWIFKTGAGDAPTLPVVAFHVLSLRHYGDFIRTMRDIDPSRAGKLPSAVSLRPGGEEVLNLTHSFQKMFVGNPRLRKKMVKALREGASGINAYAGGLLSSMVRLYNGDRSRHLNFYGPPGTIQTVSYEQALGYREKHPEEAAGVDVAGKVVFVGLSEKHQSEQRDGFPTVFSQPDGTDLSGVEIAATAFANLVEDKLLRPLGWRARLLLLLGWGMALGFAAVALPTVFAIAAIMAVTFLYGAVAMHQFQSAGVWYPMVSTLMVQAPFALAAAILWKSATTQRTIRRLVPGPGVDHTGGLSKVSREIYGVCLFTDVMGYTTVSEEMHPSETTKLMNLYFDVVSAPVSRYQGTIYDFGGDSILAWWDGKKADAYVKSRACAAALGISASLERFNRTSGEEPLLTRIGLHAGFVNRSSVGARQHLKYTIIGDAVNTASRLEGLNKQLNTWILASGDVLEGLEGFLTREVGEFRLAGKARNVSVHELICRAEDASEDQERLCRIFSGALAAYRRRNWEKAISLFQEAKAVFGEDGPSSYYTNICRSLLEDPPGMDWSGLINLKHK